MKIASDQQYVKYYQQLISFNVSFPRLCSIPVLICNWTHLRHEAGGDTGSMSTFRCNNLFLLFDKTVSFLLRDYFQHCSNSQRGLLWVVVQQWLTDVFLGNSEERKGGWGGLREELGGGVRGEGGTSTVFSNHLADIRKTQSTAGLPNGSAVIVRCAAIIHLISVIMCPFLQALLFRKPTSHTSRISSEARRQRAVDGHQAFRKLSRLPVCPVLMGTREQRAGLTGSEGAK